ncbi:hypothetical protein ABL78_3109 [Leptomonas seymouri]|uniref:Uncharacterized protein n=1 Tax=Leptomonas seymouri TaxID=5684 RepID=A0A0N1HYD0_LEPSE|nr:hypothetical protein ABL78_3109 [Leptomonas seymouri]|eukprot:KPI87810.1 hypothetical protein ABL78_3109 [Leptomonas seymouri]
MREKVVPIPFLGKEVSSWLYRTSRWTRDHPYKSAGILCTCIVGSILYEAQVTHKNRIPSPNVNNHLEYQLRDASLWERWFQRGPPQRDMKADATQLAAQHVELKETLLTDAEIKRQQQLSQRTIADTEALLARTTDPAERAALEKVIEQEQKLMVGVNNTTMVVRSGQLTVRAPHWDIRNNERNWSILSRDQQQQKDHYWYRHERSREDDYARNTYSRP